MRPQEYTSYLDPVTYGHNSAAGAIGVAAYPFFAPFVPEAFTSPGPSTIYFDKDSKRLRRTEYRRSLDLAAMDGANTTFFTSDTAIDDDTLPNFFGTSAAAPHAAAIAALVLDAAGGPGSVKPRKMREILQDSAFAHDLDPFFSWGLALSRGNFLAIDANADPNAISQFDPNVFSVTHFGRSASRDAVVERVWRQSHEHPGRHRVRRAVSAIAGAGPALRRGTHGRPDRASMCRARSRCRRIRRASRVNGSKLDLKFQAGTFGSGDELSFGVDRDEADVQVPAARPAATPLICSAVAC